jgi:hypothetical protein
LFFGRQKYKNIEYRRQGSRKISPLRLNLIFVFLSYLSE